MNIKNKLLGKTTVGIIGTAALLTGYGLGQVPLEAVQVAAPPLLALTGVGIAHKLVKLTQVLLLVFNTWQDVKDAIDKQKGEGQ
jgi:hypothetical protein